MSFPTQNYAKTETASTRNDYQITAPTVNMWHFKMNYKVKYTQVFALNEQSSLIHNTVQTQNSQRFFFHYLVE